MNKKKIKYWTLYWLIFVAASAIIAGIAFQFVHTDSIVGKWIIGVLIGGFVGGVMPDPPSKYF